MTVEVSKATRAKVLGMTMPFLCLAAPSIWLLMTVPPLWRDIDAYIQLTWPPGPSTILLHGPLYCAIARLPLWLGYLGTHTSSPISFQDFMRHPRLTDVGIYILVWLQHVGLWIGLTWLLAAISASILVRTVLAIFCASQPIFYAFAHCVGSETLSMIEIIFLVGMGLRIVTDYPKVNAGKWFVAGGILICCVLTRHINALLAVLLPLAVVLSAFVRWLKPNFRRNKERIVPRFELARHARLLTTSIAVGLAAILLANGATRIFCRSARIRYRSEMGFTFLWRLNFLQSMSSPARHHLLDAVAAKTKMPESRTLLSLISASIDQNRSWHPEEFAHSARAALTSPTAKSSGDRFDRALDEVASAFLSLSPEPLVSTAMNDFAISTMMTEGTIARYLFTTTEYVDDHRAQMPQCSGLITFRLPPEALRHFMTATYFRLWDFLAIRAWLVVWVTIAGGAAFLGLSKNSRRVDIITYGIALLFAGTMMVLVNCFFAEILPRFSLPMMEVILLSLVILLGLLLAESAAMFPQTRSLAVLPISEKEGDFSEG
jgi:hypothetical protein